MGCLKLTYSTETTTPSWQVWTVERGEKEVKEVIDAQDGGCPDCPSPALGRNANDWVDLGVAVNAIFANGIEIGTSPGQKPHYWEPKDYKNAARVGKRLATRLSIAGATVSLYQAMDNPTGGNVVDAIFSGVTLIPGAGTTVGGIYFGIDLLTIGITGQGISDHIDDYIWMPNPAGIGFIPVTKKPGR